MAPALQKFWKLLRKSDSEGFDICAREELAKGGTSLIRRRIYANGHREIEKVLNPRFQGQPKYEALQEREFTILSDLKHPGLIRCLRLETVRSLMGGKTSVLIFEDRDSVSLDALRAFVDGLTIEERNRFCLELAGALVEILKYIHSIQIVHGDLSPENILIDSFGFVRVIDFACSLRDGVRPHDFQVKGKLNYRAPESVEAGALSHSGDVFAVGKILEEFIGEDLRGQASWKVVLNQLIQERELPDWGASSLRVSVLPSRNLFMVRGRRLEKTKFDSKAVSLIWTPSVRVVALLFATALLTSWMPQKGTLTLNSWPKASVIVDALNPKMVYETPISQISLPAGKHRVRFVSSQKHFGFSERDVMVLPGENLKVFEDFAKN